MSTFPFKTTEFLTIFYVTTAGSALLDFQKNNSQMNVTFKWKFLWFTFLE